MKEKVVLAYSGGLDTTALIPWLKETFDYDVVCCCVNCGQGNELDGLEERAKLSGASKLYIEDIVDDFCDNYIMPCVEAGAVYEHKYQTHMKNACLNSEQRNSWSTPPGLLKPQEAMIRSFPLIQHHINTDPY